MPPPEQPADFAGAFMDDYYAECEEHITAVRRRLLALEAAIGQADAPPAIVEELFRSFHSLKGISAMVEMREAERLAHEMESVLRAMRLREILLSTATLDALVDGVNMLEQVIQARRSGAPMPAIEEIGARLAAVAGQADPKVGTTPADVRLQADTPASDNATLWRITFTPSAALVARGVKVDTIRAKLLEIGQITSVTPRVTQTGIAFDFDVSAPDETAFASLLDKGVQVLAIDPESALDTVPSAGEAAAAAPPSRTSESASVAPANFVRVDLARLDDLMRLVGDLVVSRARLDDSLQRIEPFTPAAEWRTLQEHAESIERHLRDLREGVMRVRLVPVGEVFRRIPFVVRDLARDSGKRIHLDLAGQATEIDKFLIERMLDPVLHLVRNAVSHGIESPDERIAAGKRPEGTIRLSASTVGESVMLDISDDGRGLDADAIVRRARDTGVEVPAGAVDARVLLDIISAPGFSTREAADRVSGRGVGMSVVRDTIQELGGTLTLDSTPGQGTTFRMVLPLTLAITDALIVHVGDRVFAIPQSAVQEVAEVERDTIRTIENNELFTHRGGAMPAVRLSQAFGLAEGARDRMHVVIIGTGSSAAGLLVDRISGQREIVVKTINDPLLKVPGVTGATELGDGRLVLILEPAALARKRWRTPTSCSA